MVFISHDRGRKIAILVIDQLVFGARSARFFEGFRILGHQTAKISPGLRRSMSPGQILSSSGAKSLPIFLTSGILNPTAYTVPQWDSVSRERRRGAEAHSYGGLVRSRFGEAVSTSRRTNFRAHFHGLL